MPGFEIFGQEERKEVLEVLETGVLFRYGFDKQRLGRWKTKQLESELAQRVGVKFCHVCSSGTAAVMTALASCGIGTGDEVIVPPFTFIATIEAVLGVGAIPVFSEIDDTLCLDPSAIKNVCTNKTRAVMPVHMCGSMAKIDEIQMVCKNQSLTLIEDACQSLGASYKGKSVGTFGEMGCFSFDPVKTVTCGEGGAVVTDNENLYRSADAFTDHGHDHIGSDRGLEDHLVLGYNFRISELNAAVGLAQLRKLDWMLTTQKETKQRIKNALKICPNVSFRHIPDESGDSATFLSFFLPDESATRQACKELNQAGVDGCFYWYDNNWHYIRNWNHLKRLQSLYKLPQTLFPDRLSFSHPNLPQSDAIMSRTISMQIKLSWTPSQIDERIEKMIQILRKL